MTIILTKILGFIIFLLFLDFRRDWWNHCPKCYWNVDGWRMPYSSRRPQIQNHNWNYWPKTNQFHRFYWAKFSNGNNDQDQWYQLKVNKNSISNRRNLLKIEFQEGVCQKKDFKKAKFVTNWISNRRIMLKNEFQKDEIC